MSINNLVDFSTQMTVHTVFGQPEFNEVMSTVKAYSNGQPTSNILWDLRNATLQPLTSETFDLIKKLIKNICDAKRAGKVALVATGDLYNVLTQTLIDVSATEDIPFSMVAFYSMPTALKWLRANE
jgi:hypothetical protein